MRLLSKAHLYLEMFGRAPWLFATWLAGLAASMLIGVFEAQLTKTVALAAFIPVVLGMGVMLEVRQQPLLCAVWQLDESLRNLVLPICFERQVSVFCLIALWGATWGLRSRSLRGRWSDDWSASYSSAEHLP